MSKPVTSTNVATNGVEEAAGSAPNRFNKSGKVEPTNVPQRTTPKTDTLIVKAICLRRK